MEGKNQMSQLFGRNLKEKLRDKNVTIIALGGAGFNIFREYHVFMKHEVLGITEKPEYFNRSKLKRYLFGANDADLANEITGRVVLCVGGAAGTSVKQILPYLKETADKKGMELIFVGVLPFGFEDDYRDYHAKEGIDFLMTFTKKAILIPNDMALYQKNKERTFPEALEYMNRIVRGTVAQVIYEIKKGADVSKLYGNEKVMVLYGAE